MYDKINCFDFIVVVSLVSVAPFWGCDSDAQSKKPAMKKSSIDNNDRENNCPVSQDNQNVVNQMNQVDVLSDEKIAEEIKRVKNELNRQITKIEIETCNADNERLACFLYVIDMLIKIERVDFAVLEAETMIKEMSTKYKIIMKMYLGYLYLHQKNITSALNLFDEIDEIFEYEKDNYESVESLKSLLLFGKIISEIVQVERDKAFKSLTRLKEACSVMSDRSDLDEALSYLDIYFRAPAGFYTLSFEIPTPQNDNTTFSIEEDKYSFSLPLSLIFIANEGFSERNDMRDFPKEMRFVRILSK